jgi:hypothetical protein
MLLKEWIKAQGNTPMTGHAEVDRVVNLLAEENFDVLELDKLSNVFVIHVARHMADGAQEDAMVICPDLSNPDAGYIMRDGGKGDVTPARVPLSSYGRTPS